MSFVFTKRVGGAKDPDDPNDPDDPEVSVGHDESEPEEANISEPEEETQDDEDDDNSRHGEDDEDNEDNEDNEDDEGHVGEEDDEDDEEEDEDEDEDDDEYLDKLKRMKTVEDLHVLHHELEQHNYEEVLERSKIVRNEANMIVDPNHRTIPYVTKYERARILGIRTKQLNAGHASTIQTRYRNNAIVAQEEYRLKKIPFIIRRPLPNGTSEYWRFADLEQIS